MQTENELLTKGGSNLEDTVFNIDIQNHYPEQIIRKVVYCFRREIQISAHDSDLECLCWRCKNSPVSSDSFILAVLD